MTYPEYVAITPRVRISIAPPIIPIDASTEGRDRIPRDTVSAIMITEHCHHFRVLYLTSPSSSSPKGSLCDWSCHFEDFLFSALALWTSGSPCSDSGSFSGSYGASCEGRRVGEWERGLEPYSSIVIAELLCCSWLLCCSDVPLMV